MKRYLKVAIKLKLMLLTISVALLVIHALSLLISLRFADQVHSQWALRIVVVTWNALRYLVDAIKSKQVWDLLRCAPMVTSVRIHLYPQSNAL